MDSSFESTFDDRYETPYSAYENLSDFGLFSDSPFPLMVKTEQFATDFSSSLDASSSDLDEIDRDDLLYEKTFTQLTPAKSGFSNMITDFDFNSSFDIDRIERDLREPSGTLTGLGSSGTSFDYSGDSAMSILNQQSLPFDESPIQDFNSITANNELPRFKDLFTPPKEDKFIKHEAMQSLENTPEKDYRNSFSQNSPLPPFSSEYPNFGTPNFENSNFTDYEIAPADFEEPESDVSSSASCSSFTDDFHCTPNECGKSSWLREIRVGKNNRPRGPKCWEFILRMLHDPASNPSYVKWEDLSKGSFRLVEKDKIADMWGKRSTKKRSGRPIKYESFARIMRYHYKSGMVCPVSEKHLVYRFPETVMNAVKAGNIL